MSPLARLRVQIVGIESLGLLQLLEDAPDILHLLPVHRVARDVAQVGKLQVQRAELGQDTAAATRPVVVLADLFI